MRSQQTENWKYYMRFQNCHLEHKRIVIFGASYPGVTIFILRLYWYRWYQIILIILQKKTGVIFTRNLVQNLHFPLEFPRIYTVRNALTLQYFHVRKIRENYMKFTILLRKCIINLKKIDCHFRNFS